MFNNPENYEDDQRIEDRANDAAAELLEGATITFQDYPKNVKLTTDDIITLVFEDDRLTAAFLDMIKEHPKCKLRELFDHYAYSEAIDRAVEEASYLARLEAEHRLECGGDDFV